MYYILIWCKTGGLSPFEAQRYDFLLKWQSLTSSKKLQKGKIRFDLSFFNIKRRAFCLLIGVRATIYVQQSGLCCDPNPTGHQY